ncbi:MAG TPA: bifunctional alpha/beta hydrolase/OsmC family protein [Longimicrobiales bacterium]
MPSKPIRFPASQGHELAARLELPATTPRAFALFAHCFTCSKDSKAAAYISQALAARGIAVLRFDFTGLGMSGGDFADSTFSSNVGDLLAAVNYLRAQHQAPQLLIGHSLGGAAVLAAAHDIAEARAVATIGSPYEPKHVAQLLKEGKDQILAAGEAEVDIGGRPFTIRKQFLEDLEQHDPANTIGNLRKALLILHSPRDRIVDINNAASIFMAAKHPKSFISLDDADHLLSRAEDAAYAAEVLAAWASRYLAQGEERVPGVRVMETGHGKFVQDILAGRHRLRADEPESAGGTDSGPSPYELLAAGLGACTAMTIRMYADHKKLPLERVTVDLAHEKIHAADCAECETREGRIDRIERVITLEGDLDTEQRARLLEIANKCPVHRTLHSEVYIPTRLVE